MKTRIVLIAVIVLLVLLMLTPLLMQDADGPAPRLDLDAPAWALVSAAQDSSGILWFRLFRPGFYGFAAFG